MDDFIQRYVQAGQTSVANYLLDHFREVGMTTDQLLVFFQLRRYMDRGTQLPNADEIAAHLGWDKQKVYQLLHELITNKLMTITTVTDSQGQKQDAYDFRLLTEKLSQLAVQETHQAAKATVSNDRSAVFNQIETEFGRPLSPLEMESITQWLDQDHYRPELIQLALKEAVLSQAYSLKYMDRILLSWERKNLKTAAQVQREKERQEPRRTNQSTGGNQGGGEVPDVPIFKLTDQ
ncbi:DnaD domain-containing protein [Levilactobacillus yiduensis]|uniref:DnaD domain-containing protein n=1 Tax=Levilactobacillus yiduensis TaxID=2953880 RepID=UPI000EF357E2|nr:DnaD domain protein [Levilactobacillus yiduensis]AYM03329.1 DnaD domain protein [Levilactobacillus brevis]